MNFQGAGHYNPNFFSDFGEDQDQEGQEEYPTYVMHDALLCSFFFLLGFGFVLCMYVHVCVCVLMVLQHISADSSDLIDHHS